MDLIPATNVVKQRKFNSYSFCLEKYATQQIKVIILPKIKPTAKMIVVSIKNLSIK
jgi:hypothetical protein